MTLSRSHPIPLSLVLSPLIVWDVAPASSLASMRIPPQFVTSENINNWMATLWQIIHLCQPVAGTQLKIPFLSQLPQSTSVTKSLQSVSLENRFGRRFEYRKFIEESPWDWHQLGSEGNWYEQKEELNFWAVTLWVSGAGMALPQSNETEFVFPCLTSHCV